MICAESKNVETKNRNKLSSTFYFPDGEMKGAVLIVPAMGVTQNIIPLLLHG